jgi:hypothetical protein
MLHLTTMKKAALAAVLLTPTMLFVGCAHTPAASPSSAENPASLDYNEKFDPWRASNWSLDPAMHGDRDAQIAFFLAGYVRLSQPYLGGEDLEQMYANYQQLLDTLGDDAFSTALRRQRPEVRSAAAAFLNLKNIQKADPETYRLLLDAPKIEWPMGQQ